MGNGKVYKMARYNLKRVDYGEFVQYRIYDRPICKNEEQKENKEQKQEVEKNDKTDKKDNKDTGQTNNNRSEQVSINRSIQTVYKYAQANTWQYFVTLTFKRDGKVNVYDYADCVKKLTVWLNNQRKKCTDFKYLFVPEMHKDGAFHFHGLIANCDGLTFSDSGRVAIGNKAYKRTQENQYFPTIYNMENWKYGWSTATAVVSSCKSASYICKYITKDLIQGIGKRRRFYPSNNLDLPEESEHFFDMDSLDALIESFGDALDFSKTQDIPEAHQRIRYYTVMQNEQ